MSEPSWTTGNQLELLENGEAFYPAVFRAIEAARHEVLLETFIWMTDGVGHELRDALIAAARRGVSVDVTVDGYGAAELAADPDQPFVAGLIEAGVRLHVYGPLPPLPGLQAHLFRRLHRKLVVVDGDTAFVGGINYSDDHLRSFGERSKQDFSARVTGPAARQIRAFCRQALAPPASSARHRLRGLLRRLPRGWARPPAGAQVLFASRDNLDHRTSIETLYRLGLRSARRDVIIMNAYFFPGWRFLRALKQAVRRGARVRLVFQGEPDLRYVRFAGATLYDRLLRIGVEIWEYMERPAHAKVAVIDDRWATVGSSNLDPFSLSLNLEANLFIRDADFNATLRARLEDLLARHGRQVTRDEVARRNPLWHLWRWLGYHLTRLFPKLAGLVPVQAQPLATLTRDPAADQPRDRYPA